MRKLVAAGAGMLALVVFPAPAAAATTARLDRRRPHDLERGARTSATPSRASATRSTRRRCARSSTSSSPRNWKRKLPSQTRIPGPLIKARVGDRLRIHFKNMDTLRRDPHSMHFHGVHYAVAPTAPTCPASPAATRDVKPGQTWTYRLTRRQGLRRRLALPRPLAVDGGLDRRRHVRDALDPRPHERRPTASSRSSSRRSASSWRSTAARSSATRRSSTSRVGDLVQWDVMAMGSDHHTFHVHGHRWLDPAASRATRRRSARPRASASAGARRTRDVALPLPRRGPHDARHDRHLPGVGR